MVPLPDLRALGTLTVKVTKYLPEEVLVTVTPRGYDGSALVPRSLSGWSVLARVSRPSSMVKQLPVK